MTTDNPIKAWVDEHRAIHAAATEGPWARRGSMGINPEGSLFGTESTDVGQAWGPRWANDVNAIVDAHNVTVPTALSMIEAVLELHSELVVYALDDVNGVWKYDENGEQIVLARLCQECSSDECVEAIDDGGWDDSTDLGEVNYPCATRRALEGVIDGE